MRTIQIKLADGRVITKRVDERGIVPNGGTTGQILGKLSDTDFDIDWIDDAGSDLTGDQLDAIINANNPSLYNVFATMDDLPANELTADELAAINGANSPSAGNVFATMDDLPSSGETYAAGDGIEIVPGSPDNIIKLGGTIEGNEQVNFNLSDTLFTLGNSATGASISMRDFYGASPQFGSLTIMLKNAGNHALISFQDQNDDWQIEHQIYLDSVSMTIRHKTNGLEYAADYSSRNTSNDRWLPDKAYVDAAVAGGGQLTVDELAAINGANSPSAANVFATMNDLTGAAYWAGDGIDITSGVISLGGTIDSTTVINLADAILIIGNSGADGISILLNDNATPSMRTLTNTVGDGETYISLQLQKNFIDDHFQYWFLSVDERTSPQTTVNAFFGQRGFEYQDDYSSLNATNDRWIPDKAYVDAAIGGSGSLTTDQIAAITGANSPSAANVFLTENDLPSPELSGDELDAINGANSPSQYNVFATMADIPADELSVDELAAINGANSPSAANVFATMNDIPADELSVDELAAITGASSPSAANVFLTDSAADSLYAAIANGVTGGNSHDHSGGDGAQISHLNLSNIGSSSHATIDTYLGYVGEIGGILRTKSINDNSLTTVLRINPTSDAGVMFVIEYAIAYEGDGAGQVTSGSVYVSAYNYGTLNAQIAENTDIKKTAGIGTLTTVWAVSTSSGYVDVQLTANTSDNQPMTLRYRIRAIANTAHYSITYY